VIHHLAGLSPGARQLALAASVIGRDFEEDLLRAVIGLDEAATMDALRELSLRHILEEPATGRLRFLHDKLREIAYAEIPAAERGPLHLRAALGIEELRRDAPDFARFYPRLAHHFTRAGEAARAVFYLEKAAGQALGSFANREAVGFLRELIALGQAALLDGEGARAGQDLSAIGDIVSRRRLVDRDRLSLVRWERQLAEAYFYLGDAAAVVRHAGRALAWAGRPPPSGARGLGDEPAPGDPRREALDPNGQLIVDLVPELKFIIGEQPPVPELSRQDAQGRFQLVFRRFISVFTREHPLALFFDDLQWLDAATLDLIEDLLTRPDLQHLMLIGAYRTTRLILPIR